MSGNLEAALGIIVTQWPLSSSGHEQASAIKEVVLAAFRAYHGQPEKPDLPKATHVEAGMEFRKEGRKYRVVAVEGRHFWVEDECGGHGTWGNEDIPVHNPAIPEPKKGDVVRKINTNNVGVICTIAKLSSDSTSYEITGPRIDCLCPRESFRIIFRPVPANV